MGTGKRYRRRLKCYAKRRLLVNYLRTASPDGVETHPEGDHFGCQTFDEGRRHPKFDQQIDELRRVLRESCACGPGRLARYVAKKTVVG
jgi:hypothetical protein